MAKCSTDTCCLTLPLRLEKWQEDRLAKRFEIARQIYNTMVRAELKKLRAVEQSEPYKANQEKIQALDWKTQADKQALKALYKERDKLFQKRREKSPLQEKRGHTVPARIFCNQKKRRR